MAFNLGQKIRVSSKHADIDERKGPFNSITEALNANSSASRDIGRTVYIIENNKVVEYWFEAGTADSDLVKKTQGGSGELKPVFITTTMTDIQALESETQEAIDQKFATWIGSQGFVIPEGEIWFFELLREGSDEGSNLTLEQARQNSNIVEGLIVGNEEFNKQENRKAFAQISDVQDYVNEQIEARTKEVTKSELDTLISNSQLVEGALYKITDAESWMINGDTTKAIYLHAISNTELDKRGVGEFYVPNYDKNIQGYGIWQGEVFQAFPDDVPEPIYNIGDKVIWGGKVWESITGNLGIKENHFKLNSDDWQVIEPNDTDYALRVNIIDYDLEHDMIIYRKDDAGNEISTSYENWKYWENDYFDGKPLEESIYNPIKIFQWGNEFDYNLWKGVGTNISKNSIFECINQCGSINNNTLNTGSIYNNTLNNGGYINNNTLNTGSMYNNTLTNGGIYFNTLNNDGGINNNTLNTGSIYNNTLNGNGYINNNTLNTGSIRNLIVNSGNIGANGAVDLSSATIIYQDYERIVFKNSAGITKIRYFNENDVLVIADITD